MESQFFWQFASLEIIVHLNGKGLKLMIRLNLEKLRAGLGSTWDKHFKLCILRIDLLNLLESTLVNKPVQSNFTYPILTIQGVHLIGTVCEG